MELAENSSILIADDDRTIRRLLHQIMAREGYRVIEANDGEQCLSLYRTMKPDIVLVDAMMPELDGFEVCERLRKESDDDQLPILMITSLDDNDSVDHAFAVGASDYVTKPIHWAVLRQRVRRLLRARHAEAVLRESEMRHRAVVNAAFNAIITVTGDSIIRDFNPGAARTFGYSASEAIGQPFSLLVPEHMRDIYLARFRRLVQGRSQRLLGRTLEGLARRKDASELPVELTVAVIEEARGTTITGVVRDITERKAIEAQMSHRAFYDALTGLPNRTLFTDRLEQALARAARRKTGLAVLFLDLDGFKTVNDSFGHEAGDHLLATVARRLQTCVRRVDTVARQGGDEFTMILEEIHNESDATSVASRIVERIQEAIALPGGTAIVTTSIGIALSTAGDIPSEELIRRADIAMYWAKHDGKSRYVIFDPTHGHKPTLPHTTSQR